MNVIVSNKQKDIIDNANIDAIKDLNGLFSIDDLLSKFKNYFFSKMILDATSIIDFSSKEVLEKLATEIGGERLIILLPPSPEPPPEFVNKLIDLKIYNFSTNINDVVRLLTNPNTAETFANRGISNDEQMYVDNSIRANNGFANPNPTFDNQNMNSGFANNNFPTNGNFGGVVNPASQFDAGQNTYTNDAPIGNPGVPMGMPQAVAMDNSPMGVPQMNANQNTPVGMPQSSINQNIPVGIPQTSINQNIPVGIPQSSINQNVPMGIPQVGGQSVPQNGYNGMPNAASGMNGNYMNNSVPQNNMNVANNFNYAPRLANNQSMHVTGNAHDFYHAPNNEIGNALGLYNGDKKIYGIKNITPHAGSTTLTYLLMKEVANNTGKKTLAIEIDKHDFIYFPNKHNMVSVEASSLMSVIARTDAEIVFIDLNNYRDFSVCNEVLYLIEPSTIKLNLLMHKSRIAFKALANKKIVLNQSLLSNSDLKILSNEAGVEFFMNIPPLNDRVSNNIIMDLFEKL